MLGYTPPGADTPQSRHPPGADTPPEQTPPPLQCMLGDTENTRAVRILQERNLVIICILVSVGRYKVSCNHDFECNHVFCNPCAHELTTSSVQSTGLQNPGNGFFSIGYKYSVSIKIFFLLTSVEEVSTEVSTEVRERSASVSIESL